MTADDSLPNDIEILKELVRRRDAELALARAEASNAEALITHLRLTVEKLKRDLFGPRNERKARLIEQMELALEELEAAAGEESSRQQQPIRCAPSPAGSRRGSRSRRICRASALSFPARPLAPAVARADLPSSARM
jgi:hypothetical protein